MKAITALQTIMASAIKMNFASEFIKLFTPFINLFGSYKPGNLPRNTERPYAPLYSHIRYVAGGPSTKNNTLTLQALLPISNLALVHATPLRKVVQGGIHYTTFPQIWQKAVRSYQQATSIIPITASFGAII